MTASAKGLFQAMRPKVAVDPRQMSIAELPTQTRPKQGRRENDFYPTAETDALRALLAVDGPRIRALGSVWEPACGDGAMVTLLRSEGIPCSASDLVQRGCPDSWQADYFTCLRSRCPSIITNPPFNLITARDGHGRWLRHTLDMPGWTYLALLLDWNWPAGKINGLGALLDARPFTRSYLMRWKLDFTGQGQAPQRNAWFVFDREDPRSYDGRYAEPSFCFLDRLDDRQKEFQL